MTLGPLAGDCARPWRDASRRPLGRAYPGEGAVIPEGIEDGLSVALARPERRVLVSPGNMASVALPTVFGEVTIRADNDAPGLCRRPRRWIARWRASSAKAGEYGSLAHRWARISTMP